MATKTNTQKETTTKKELVTKGEIVPTAIEAVGIPSSIAENFIIEQVTFNYLVPAEGEPAFLKFLEPTCKKQKVTGIQNEVFCTKVCNLETGETMLLVIKQVLLKVMLENGFFTGDDEQIDISPCLDKAFAIVAHSKRNSKEGGKSYTPYTVSVLTPRT